MSDLIEIEHTIEELIKSKKHNNLTIIIFNEINSDMTTSEMEKSLEAISELSQKNMIHGGSEHGYYYENELYVAGSSYVKGEISPIHEDLFMEAQNIKDNRIELQQDVTYIGNFLSVMNSSSDNCVTLIANLPTEISKFSNSVRRLESHYLQSLGETWREDNKLKLEEPAAAIFQLHLDRVEPQLKRYLFRRITR